MILNNMIVTILYYHSQAERARTDAQFHQQITELQQEQAQLQEDKRQLTANLNSTQQSLQVNIKLCSLNIIIY